MKRNEKCWCGSGQKWKRCHKDREYQEPVNGFQQAEAMREKMSEGFCSYTDESGVNCSGKPITSHTVQRRGGLADIQENNHVLSNKFSFADLAKNNGQPQIKRLGTNKASTFPGFCSAHDGKLFEPIERPGASLNSSTAFLLAFRAICFEHFRKHSVVKAQPLLRQMDRGKPFEMQARIQSLLDAQEQGLKLGVRDIDTWKARYLGALHRRDLSEFHYSATYFDRTLPMVVCSAWLVETDFHGNMLQKLGTTAADLEHITFNLTRIGDTTAAIFGWIGSNDGAARQFVESFKSVPDERKSCVIASMAFEHSENVFMRESWWNQLDPGERRALHARILNGVANGRRNGALVDDGNNTMPALAIKHESC